MCRKVPTEYESKYDYIQDPERRKFLGMVTILDEAIGNITQKLRDLDMLDDTLIVFTSDNGGAVYTSGRNYPLRGGKMTAFEGGKLVITIAFNPFFISIYHYLRSPCESICQFT